MTAAGILRLCQDQMIRALAPERITHERNPSTRAAKALFLGTGPGSLILTSWVRIVDRLYRFIFFLATSSVNLCLCSRALKRNPSRAGSCSSSPTVPNRTRQVCKQPCTANHLRMDERAYKDTFSPPRRGIITTPQACVHQCGDRQEILV